MTSNIQIKTEKFFKAFINGAKAVILKEKHLNDINVFPVKDADTGSNLRSLMDSVINKSKMEPTLKETLESISNAALIGSKGNSGLIFSQFIYGLSKDVDKDYFEPDMLVNQIKKGYEFAYEAIDMPVEGTMITLMRNWYHLLNDDLNSSLTFEEYLIETNHKLQKSLESTKSLLPVLKKYNVVDAGALAFTTFVDGFVRSMTDENFVVDIEKTETVEFDAHDHNHEEQDIDYRYCTEILIKTQLEKDSLKQLLDHHGDSLVIGKSSEFYKIHIHSNEPDKILEYISNYATIVDSKVDDMKNQNMLNHHRKYDIAVLTDSISDINKNLMDYYQIQVFPISINVDGTIYFDKRSINNKRLLDLIETGQVFPKSASPSIDAVKKQILTLKKVYKKVLIVTVSSKMSSTYQIFKKAVDEIASLDIKLIDSKQNSVSEGLVAYEAARMIERGISFEEIVKQSELNAKNAKILVQVKSLDNMVRGGRVSKGLGLVAKILNLKPIVSINQDGEGTVLSKTIGRKNSFKKILSHIKKEHKKYGIKSYAISYVDNMKEAEKFKASLIRMLGFLPEYVTESSAVIAMNAGKDAVAVGYIKGN